jgi:hypothetical protein
VPIYTLAKQRFSQISYFNKIREDVSSYPLVRQYFDVLVIYEEPDSRIWHKLAVVSVRSGYGSRCGEWTLKMEKYAVYTLNVHICFLIVAR